jgi:hypothetical protein
MSASSAGTASASTATRACPTVRRSDPHSRAGDDAGLLISRLVVEGAEPALVAQERGVSRTELVDLLRDAVDGVAVAYEDLANGYLDVPESPEEALVAVLGHTGAQ